MVAGLKFLSKKSFNPQNLTNQKNVYERQQEAKQEATKIRERNEQLKRERDDEELALARGDSIKVSFLYQAPPGMEGTQNSKQTGDIGQDDEKPEASILLAHRQPGDDDAAAKFRALLAGQLTDEAHEQSSGEQVQSGFSFALHGSEYDPINNSDKKKEPSNLTALEKAAGRLRKKDSLTLEGQIERFPALANAPRAKGISSADIGVNFKVRLYSNCEYTQWKSTPSRLSSCIHVTAAARSTDSQCQVSSMWALGACKG
jgi:CBF1 interacting corepressor